MSKSTRMHPYVRLFESKYYTGEPLEKGGTSIMGKEVAGLAYLLEIGALKGAKTILDYGAGKYGRNSKYLRMRGYNVYSYDPYNGSDADGWTDVSNKLPDEKFDIGFTSYVLNVVPEHIETEILSELKELCKKQFHITRNMDIYDTVSKALERKDPIVYNFFTEEFGGTQITRDTAIEFCKFGVQTSKGFQRIPFLEEKGFTLLKKTNGFKVYG